MTQAKSDRLGDIALLLKAAAFAAHKHKDQRRKDVEATPYINHPLALAQALCEEGAVDDPVILAAAQQVKIADKLCNLREILGSPPAKWSESRKHEYFDWAKRVVDQIRHANPRLAERFHRVYESGRGRN